MSDQFIKFVDGLELIDKIVKEVEEQEYLKQKLFDSYYLATYRDDIIEGVA